MTNPEPATIALTGITGFVGNNLAHHLLASGYCIQALVRGNKAIPAAIVEQARHKQLSVTAVRGDLHDQDALQQLTRNCQAVIHCAATVRGASQSDFDHANVTGTDNLALASAATGTHRLIHLSSLAASQPQLSWYARSKYLAEQILTEHSKLQTSILRPPAIYGPGDREMLPLFKMLHRGLALRVTARQQRVSLLHVDDLCRAIIALLSQQITDTITTRTMCLHDGHERGYSWSQLCDIVARHSQRKVISIPVPRQLLVIFAHINLLLSRLRNQLPMLSPGKVRELHWPDWTCDNSAISTAIGWQPDIQLTEGLESLGL